MNGKVPQHTSFHFLLVSSKILVFAESFCNATTNRARKHSKKRAIHESLGVEVIPQGTLEGDHMANGRVEICERSEIAMQNTQNFR